jgi:hypothetical protein
MNFVNYYSSPHKSPQHLQNTVSFLKTTKLQAETAIVKLPFLLRAKAAISEGRLISGMKRRLKPIFIAIGKSALRRPWIKRSVLTALNVSPDLKNRLYRLVWKDVALSPRAMRIYTSLSNAIPTHSKGNN